jgi:uncharacterized protein with von Willebrand factor type A (vWA) domain
VAPPALSLQTNSERSESVRPGKADTFDVLFDRPIPGLTIPKTSGIPLHNLSLGPQDRLGKKRAEREERKRVQAAAEAEAREKMDVDVKGKGKGRESLEDVVRRGVEVDDAKFEKPLSRKEKLKVGLRVSLHRHRSVRANRTCYGHLCSFPTARRSPKHGHPCQPSPRPYYPKCEETTKPCISETRWIPRGS